MVAYVPLKIIILCAWLAIPTPPGSCLLLLVACLLLVCCLLFAVACCLFSVACFLLLVACLSCLLLLAACCLFAVHVACSVAVGVVVVVVHGCY